MAQFLRLLEPKICHSNALEATERGLIRDQNLSISVYLAPTGAQKIILSSVCQTVNITPRSEILGDENLPVD